MSEEQSIQDLMRQAIEAAREGKKAEAKALFQQVVDRDDKNEKAWMWLASVVETDEERRVCLSNALFINPNNERAQAAMAKLDARSQQQQQDEEVIPGISRRQLLIFGGGGAGLIVLIIIIFLVITGNRNAQNAEATRVIADLQGTGTAVVAMAATDNANATATVVALTSPTPTATNLPAQATLPPEMSLVTPSPVPLATATPLPYPTGLTGRIFGWSGRDVTQTGFLSVVAYNLANNGEAVTIAEVQARNVDVSADGQRLVYTRYFSSTTFDTGVEQIGIDGTGADAVLIEQPVLKAQMAHYCPTHNQIVFVALPTTFQGEVTATIFPYQVFTFNFDTKVLSQLTNDRASYSYPAYSPDCSRIAVVKSELAGANIGSDLFLIDTASLGQTAMTNDSAAYIEASPHWSPDGTQLSYSVHPKDILNNNDIIVRRADPSSTPLVLVKDPSNDISPVFSPDGKYIAFSSNRNGSYDIYVLDLATSIVYQLTSTVEQDYPGGWAS